MKHCLHNKNVYRCLYFKPDRALTYLYFKHIVYMSTRNTLTRNTHIWVSGSINKHSDAATKRQDKTERKMNNNNYNL
jgi:hypothetical protein